VTDEAPASLMICAAINTAGNEAALKLVRGIYRAVWVEDRDIAQADTLIQIADEGGLDGKALYEGRDDARQLYEQYTQSAIDAQVFGAPWYVYNGEPFWGQDRLEFLDRALARG